MRIIKTDGKTEFETLAGLAGRGGEKDTAVESAVAEIIEEVRANGDAAVKAYTGKFDGDGAAEAALRVIEQDELKEAFRSLPRELALALLHMADNIRSYHAKQKIEPFEEKKEDGSIIGQTVRGLERVGLYVPGGTAAYPSTVLMNAIPAKLAGVGEIVAATPPRRTAAGAYGADAALLGAAYISGVDKVILGGGAQAVAALAFGTETFPRVDKIVGPGNTYVATAKKLLYGIVDIDMVAGPSEILIVASPSATAAFAAADLLSQAEHDPKAASVLLTTSEGLASAVASEVERQLAFLSRTETARASIEQNGIIIVCKDDSEMAELANAFAPEHLELMVEDPLAWLPLIKNAGSIFCGQWTPEPVGDYYAGVNHVLPTSGTARFSSPLSVYDFLKRTSYTYYTKEALAAAKNDIIAISSAEGLTAHRDAVKIRFEE